MDLFNYCLTCGRFMEEPVSKCDYPGGWSHKLSNVNQSPELLLTVVALVALLGARGIRNMVYDIIGEEDYDVSI